LVARVDLPDFRVDRGEDRAEEGEVRAPIMFEKRSQVDMLSLVRSVPPRGLSSRGDKLYIISGHVKSDPMVSSVSCSGFRESCQSACK